MRYIGKQEGIKIYTAEDVLMYIEEENVQFIRLSFCDIQGRQKNLTIMPDELKRAFQQGISFDASAIAGFVDVKQSDLFLYPDPSTLSIVPWHPIHGKMVRMFCGIKYPNGSQFLRDTRYLLQQAVKAAAQKGLTCYFGAEFEFYLFKLDENGERTEIPFDQAGYLDMDPGDKCEQIRREICFTLMDMGIKPEIAHHEEGPGQNEIDFRYSNALKAADEALTFKSVVRTIAMRNGLYANFSPKPLAGQSGNGLHINMSLQSQDGQDYTRPFMAGIMEHIEALTLFLNPSEQSYQRLGEMKAPRYVSWSPENRSQLFRIPAAQGKYRRIELRSPDPGANPYLAYALLIRAGLDGIERQLEPGEPININLYQAKPENFPAIRALPRTLAEARQKAERDSWLQTVLPEDFLPVFLALEGGSK